MPAATFVWIKDNVFALMNHKIHNLPQKGWVKKLGIFSNPECEKTFIESTKQPENAYLWHADES